MSFVATLPAAVLETVLTRVAALFLIGAAGDRAAARCAAAHILGSYLPETEDELRLAANIICFSLQAIEALGQAAGPDIPLALRLRLRGGAVSLSGESAKAARRLGELQKARQQGNPANIQPEHVQPGLKIEAALALLQDGADLAVGAKSNDPTQTQSYEQRQRDARTANGLDTAAARKLEQASVAVPWAGPDYQKGTTVH